ncbi:MAG: urea ABC transporter ATP-binding subunit UrtE [Betaproteobacteria bacterium]|jgi:urea transport system ATP-binding protein|nr:urea ABC transporter ATP-binding subunit UrtE [Betaproteobacteria bacterium]NBP44157.1 urea ABC transporter ATP-binding subunit UrtE [Betaproteobacteria bacterium]
MLRIEQLHQYYGGSHILRGVNLTVHPGQITVLLGRNGVGKTTLLKTLMGLVHPRSGEMLMDGQSLVGLKPEQRVRMGLGYVPQGREIFNRLTVEDNLRMGMATRPGREPLPQEILSVFPVLGEMLHRRGGDLSGGQQQQLAIARALASQPKMLILDEPTEGIQPNIIKDMGRIIQWLAHEKGMGILLCEQYYDFAQQLADHFVVMERGEVVASGEGADQMREQNIRALVSI